MTTTKKTKPADKKAECVYGKPVMAAAASMSTILESAGRTMAKQTAEDIAYRKEVNKVQLDMMKADLRKRIAEADTAEAIAARVKGEYAKKQNNRKARSPRK